MKNNFDLFKLCMLPMLIFTLLCLLGVIKFSLWTQVTHLWEVNSSPSKLLLHPHGLRYALVYPFFLLSEVMNVSYNWLFSVFVPLLLFIASTNIVSSIKYTDTSNCNKNMDKLFLEISMLLIFLSLFMNGRIIFSIVGSAILINYLLNWQSKSFIRNIIMVCFALLLCSVSSGTLFVAVAELIAFILFTLFSTVKRKGRILGYFIVFFIIGSIGLPLLKVLFFKNIDFFGGGIDGFIGMLTHGIGKYFMMIKMEVLVLIFLILVLLFFSTLALLFVCKRLLFPVCFFTISLCGGLFGFSTMTMAIVPIFILMCSFRVSVYKSIILPASKTVC